jgi:hypothetical protein
MSIPALRSLVVLGLVSLPCVSALGQGLYWESETSIGTATTPKTSKTWMVPQKYKVENDGMTIIARLDKETIYMVRPAEKTYSEKTFAEIEATTKAATGASTAATDASTAEIEKQLKNMPEAQRKAFEKALGQMKKPKTKVKESPVVVTKTTEMKKICGYSTTKCVATQDGKTILTAWVTKDIPEFETHRKDWQAFSKRMMEMSPAGKGLAEAYLKIDGFPLETQMGDAITVVTKISRSPATDEDFDVPSGFTKEKAPAMPTPKVPKARELPRTPKVKVPAAQPN